MSWWPSIVPDSHHLPLITKSRNRPPPHSSVFNVIIAKTIMLMRMTIKLDNGRKWDVKMKTRTIYLNLSAFVQHRLLPLLLSLYRAVALFSQNIADSFQTEYCSTFLLSVCSCVTAVTSHISHIYKGINALLIIRGPIKPYIFWIKIILAIFLAKTRPDKTIFSALTNVTIDFDFELSKI